MESIICKSIFNIQPHNKNNILVGYLINVCNISVVIIIECNTAKEHIILTQSQWDQFTSENTLKFIFENISGIVRSKRFKLDDDFCYKINTKSESVNLQHKNSSVTLSRNTIYCLKLWRDCINISIIEKNKRLEIYQRQLNNILTVMKNEIMYLSPSCVRPDFISLYIQDYKFSLAELSNEEIIFTLELQQMYNVSLVNILIKSFYDQYN